MLGLRIALFVKAVLFNVDAFAERLVEKPLAAGYRREHKVKRSVQELIIKCKFTDNWYKCPISYGQIALKSFLLLHTAPHDIHRY